MLSPAAFLLLLVACAPRDPAIRETSLSDEEQRAGRNAAFLVPIPEGARGVAYGLSSGLYSVSPLPEEARRGGRLRVTVGTDPQRCQTGQLQVWVGPTGMCVPRPSPGFSGWTVEGGLPGINRWAPLYMIVPVKRAASGEWVQLPGPGRSRWEVAAVAFTPSDGEKGRPVGLPEPSSVLSSLDDRGHLRGS